jgi:hypothetical protein
MSTTVSAAILGSKTNIDGNVSKSYVTGGSDVQIVFSTNITTLSQLLDGIQVCLGQVKGGAGGLKV